MNAYVTGLSAREDASVSRAEAFILSNRFERPTLVIDTEAVARQYAALAQGLGRARIHYAIKANPAPEILQTLVALGSNFDAASRVEIEMCLAAGADVSRISFGNTIKRSSDIAWAHGMGISHFAADSEEELHKLATHAPGAEVYIRLIVGSLHADWPLSRKFGCALDKSPSLFALAIELGLKPVGLSFHVGSQTRHAEMWGETLDQVAEKKPSEAAADGLGIYVNGILDGMAVGRPRAERCHVGESLHLAGIHPHRPAGRIAAARYERLAAAICSVLQAAIAQGGTSLRDFVQEDGAPGYFKQSLRVYARAGLPCPSCGEPVRQQRIGQRSSFYCARCQR